VVRSGYVVLANAVPTENLDRVRDETWAFLGEQYGMLEHDQESWYQTHGEPGNSHTGMVQMYQSQGQWNNRMHPAVHRAFADLWGTEALWTSFDMTHLKPPYRDEADFGGFCHWDMNETQLREGLKLATQGQLLLDDVSEDGGGFCCTTPPGHAFSPADRATFFIRLLVAQVSLASTILLTSGWRCSHPVSRCQASQTSTTPACKRCGRRGSN